MLTDKTTRKIDIIKNIDLANYLNIDGRKNIGVQLVENYDTTRDEGPNDSLITNGDSITIPPHTSNSSSSELTYILLTPDFFGEVRITKVYRNGTMININNNGASVPIGLRKGDKIVIEFSSGNLKKIKYNGSNL